MNEPDRPAHWGGAIQDRRERGDRRVRVVSGEPQRRGSDARRPEVAVSEAGQDPAGTPALSVNSRQFT